MAKANHPLTPQLAGVAEVELHQATEEEKRERPQAARRASACSPTSLSQLPGKGLSEGKGKRCDNCKEETFVIISRLFSPPIST